MKTLVVAPQPFFSFRGTPFSVYYRTLIAGEIGVDTDLLTYGRGSSRETYTDKMRVLMARVAG